MKTLITKITFTLSLSIFILSNTRAQQNRSLPDFNQIVAGQTIDIQLISADRNSLYIESGSENSVTADVANGVLKLKSNAPKSKLKIYFKELKSVKLEGAAVVSNVDTIVSPQFTISSEGASKINLILKCDVLKVVAEGASDITLAGASTNASFNLSGANILNANNLATKINTIHAEGIANAKINVTENLSAHAEGASHIIFSGNPEYKNISIDGISTVKDKASGDDFNNEIKRPFVKDGDTTKLKLFKKKFMIIDDNKKEEVENTNEKRKMKRVWSGFELGVNGFTTPQMSFNFDDKYKFLNTKIGESWFYGLNIFEADAHLIKNKLAITSGLGFLWNNTHFNGSDVMMPHSDSLAAVKSLSSLSLNKLYTFDFTVPLMIKFAPGSKKDAKGGFHIAAGAIFHYVTSASIVTETTANGYFQRTVMNDNFNINPFRVDATIRAGYSHLKFFANYSLTPYFNTSAGADVRMFSAGLTLIGL